MAGILAGIAPFAPADTRAADAGNDYLLIPRAELLGRPTSGGPWAAVVDAATADWPAPDLDDQESKVNVDALAAGLTFARTQTPAYRAKVRDAIRAMVPTFGANNSGLAPARQIAGWVMAADLIDLEEFDPAVDQSFRALLRRALDSRIGSHSRWGGSLTACHEDADNNWGAWCGASRIAASLYLGDAADVARAEAVYRGFLGDRSAWSSFKGQDDAALSSAARTWACDPASDEYVPTNPACGDKSGAFVSDASRTGGYPRFHPAYQSETTAGMVLQAELLYRNGYPDAWNAVDGALARVAAFNHANGAWNLGSVQYHWPWLINERLGTSYPTRAAGVGRALGFTDWLFG
jgi:Alginate lyase